MMGLSLLDQPLYVSGVPGHFVSADRCRLRLHWRIGCWRISTVGGMTLPGECEFATVSGDGYSETMVFHVKDNGTLEGEITDHSGIYAEREASKDTRDGESMHYRVATAVAARVAEGLTPEAMGAALEAMT